jgi:crotonobetainyl-CoA:carnitine CoA-transferase CaiB-like acyl-CoA transferase
MNAAVEDRLSHATAAEWIERLNAAGVPCGRVMGLPEVFADPQVLAQEMVLDQEHPGHGMVRMLGFPIKFAEAPCELRLPAPELGADTDTVLSGLGYSTTELTALRARGIV